jgi:hypothetical protein
MYTYKPFKKELPKVALNDSQVSRYESGESHYRIVEEVAREFNLAHVIGYGLRSQRVIIEDGVYYATWDIYDSCD